VKACSWIAEILAHRRLTRRFAENLDFDGDTRMPPLPLGLALLMTRAQPMQPLMPSRHWRGVCRVCCVRSVRVMAVGGNSDRWRMARGASSARSSKVKCRRRRFLTLYNCVRS